MMSHSHTINDNKQILNFMFGGNSTVTFKNSETGNRFTYRIRKPNDDTPFFVQAMVGSDNELSYKYLGVIFEKNGKYIYGKKKSKISNDSQVAKVFSYVYRHLLKNNLTDVVQVWHEGRCGRCGRKLTVPESIESGFGPECIKFVG